jgi:GNAT superfamily N-acetyltransferase
MPDTWRRDTYLISTDKQLLDLHAIQNLLKTSYWAADRPMAMIERSIEHSLTFGVYADEQQIGFARVITDYTTFAYLADVIIDERYRGQGLGKWLIEAMIGHPELQSIRRWLLMTWDAHALYQQYGFTALDLPERYMQRVVNVPPIEARDAD